VRTLDAIAPEWKGTVVVAYVGAVAGIALVERFGMIDGGWVDGERLHAELPSADHTAFTIMKIKEIAGDRSADVARAAGAAQGAL
jgi:Flp pilus assembly CpaF family ATPase